MTRVHLKFRGEKIIRLANRYQKNLKWIPDFFPTKKLSRSIGLLFNKNKFQRFKNFLFQNFFMKSIFFIQSYQELKILHLNFICNSFKI